MLRHERREKLWDFLNKNPKGAGMERLCEVLKGCGPATFYRVLKDLRDQGFRVPCDSHGIYRLSSADMELYASRQGLGLEESAALLLLSDRLTKERARSKPIALNSKGESHPKRFHSLLESIPKSMEDKVRWLSYRGRPVPSQVLTALLSAISSKKKVILLKEGDEEARTLSPIRVVSYRDVWYLDAYCHLRLQLRSFALDRIQNLQVTDEKVEIPLKPKEINQHFEASFGIFSGPATATCRLAFRGTALKFVQNEIWHPLQHSEWIADETYVLSFPMGEQTEELIGAILSVGDGVEVLAPQDLRDAVRDVLLRSLERYQ